MNDERLNDEKEPVGAAAGGMDIPYAYARQYGVVVASDRADGARGSDGAGGWLVHVRDGADPAALIEVKRHLGQALRAVRLSAAEFDQLLSRHYAVDASAAMAGSLDGGELDMIAGGVPSAEDLLDSADDAPAIRLINAIIAEAVRQGVSDIHIEPYDSALVVRMRADGLLREHLRMPAHVAPVVVSRIKVMARLDIAERRVPQDGRISLTLAGKAIDVRVSTLPSRGGERVVMRILDKDSAALDFEVLGLTGEADRILRDALAQPHGIILVTGPTGSGKTTTLYAALTRLNDGERNILTVEDPVEYAVDGVGQTQVNAKVGLDFAAGLRAILRQDPDVVMVGEIRDRETADIAVQASLTGHLVLSTVHTNDATGAITRLKDLKVEPFLLASTLRAVVAQRLVRRLCADCREAVPADDVVAAMLGLAVGAVIWQAKGCGACGQSGFQGRIGVFEAIRVDETLRRAIYAGQDEAVMARHAFANAPNLAAAARQMVVQGLTTAEEAMRIARRDGDAA